MPFDFQLDAFDLFPNTQPGGGGGANPPPTGNEVITGTVEIVRRSRLQCAPEQPLLRVTNLQNTGLPSVPAVVVDDPEFHHLKFEWDFGFTFDWDSGAILEHLEAAQADGQYAAPLYRDPGIFYGNCRVTNMLTGDWGDLPYQIVINNPDNIFTAADTIVVDTTGGGDVTSFNAAMNLVRGQSATPKRIQITRGQNHSVSGQSLGNGVQIPSLHITTVGSGAEPTMTKGTGGPMFFWQDTSTTGNGNDKDFVVHGGRWQGPYDPVTGSPAGNIGGFYQCLRNPPQMALFLDTNIRGFSNIFAPEGSDPSMIDAYTCIASNNMSDWQLYCVFGQRGLYAVTGNKIICNPDGGNGGSRTSGALEDGGVEGGPIRMPFARIAVVTHNEMYSNSGWLTQFGQRQTNQPAFRWCTSPRGGEVLILTRNNFEAGFSVAELKSQNSSETSQVVKALIEKNRFVSNWMSPFLLHMGHGGMTARNNIFIHVNVPSGWGPFDPQGFIQLGATGNDADNLAGRMEVYANTFINQMTTANYVNDRGIIPGVVNSAGYTNTTIAGNLDYQPNQGQTADGPVDETPVKAPYYTGYRNRAIPVKETQYASPPDGIWTGTPLAGSAALGDADNAALMPVDDYFGNTRPATNKDRGAIQVSA